VKGLVLFELQNVTYFRLCVWWWCVKILPWWWWVPHHSIYLDWSTWSKV